MNILREASAHGRFQPLHKGHCEYLLTAKERCQFLWIGITQPDINSLQASPVDHHREIPASNPLTYFERLEMITEAMIDSGLTENEFGVIPFPIETPNSLINFLPTTIPIFTTVYDQWNRHKIELLSSIGYKVSVLWERDIKLYNGVEVRRHIHQRELRWKELVPPATIRIIKKYQIEERLDRLNGASGEKSK